MEITLSPSESFSITVPSVVTTSREQITVGSTGYYVSATSDIATATLQKTPSAVVINGINVPAKTWTTVANPINSKNGWLGTVSVEVYWSDKSIQARQKLSGSAIRKVTITQNSYTLEGKGTTSVVGINFVQGGASHTVKQVYYNGVCVWDINTDAN